MKKLFVITIALLLAFALSACTPPSDQPATTAPAGTNTEAPSSSAEPSASPEPSPVPYSFTAEDMAYPFWKSRRYAQRDHYLSARQRRFDHWQSSSLSQQLLPA